MSIRCIIWYDIPNNNPQRDVGMTAAVLPSEAKNFCAVGAGGVKDRRILRFLGFTDGVAVQICLQNHPTRALVYG